MSNITGVCSTQPETVKMRLLSEALSFSKFGPSICLSIYIFVLWTQQNFTQLTAERGR